MIKSGIAYRVIKVGDMFDIRRVRYLHGEVVWIAESATFAGGAETKKELLSDLDAMYLALSEPVIDLKKCQLAMQMQKQRS